jgi:ribosome-associated toxin RatA of RatAB toxin-antitoxin module
MDIHFNHTEPVHASAETLFDVITDYTAYPSFNSAVTKVTVVTKNERGAEFVADRKTKIGKRTRAYDRYERDGHDMVIERTYEGNASARSTWRVHPLADGTSTLTIDATQSMGPVRGVIMKPALKHLFYGINFTPFIEEAERRAQAAETRLAA